MALWYNHRTGEVEEGPKSLGSDRYGPFDSREEAERAPQKLQQRAEATMNLAGQRLHAEASAEDMYAAIDLLADRERLDQLDVELLPRERKESDRRGRSERRPARAHQP